MMMMVMNGDDFLMHAGCKLECITRVKARAISRNLSLNQAQRQEDYKKSDSQATDNAKEEKSLTSLRKVTLRSE